MYGASFDCGIDKMGDNQIIKFYLETLNDNYLPDNENLVEKSINVLLDIIFNPLIENGAFKKEYFETEKNNLKTIIEGKIDNKDMYAFSRCIEEMYKNQDYGIYKYGEIDKLEKLNSKSLYTQYIELIKNAKIDIFVSGNLEMERVTNIVEANSKINNLEERCYKIANQPKVLTKEIKTIEEKKNVTQGKLVIGLDVNSTEDNYKYIARLYNVILGESAMSKLFQNVREKASLAYSARSNYIKQKNTIFIRCGIEIQNYDRALEIIKQQLEDMKNGKITEDELKNAKKYIESGIKTIIEEQDSELTYYLGQELSEELTTFEQYVENIKKVTKKDIEELAKTIDINTIYFLRN